MSATASRKLYRDIAYSFRTSLWRDAARLDHPQRAQVQVAIAATARGVAADLKRNDPAFRFDKFYAACGLDENGTP